MRRISICLSVLALAALVGGEALAQRTMATISTPFHTLNDSFFERSGISFNARSNPGARVPWTFNMGSFQQATPPFGGFQPGAGAQGGVHFQGGGFSANLFGEFSQGTRRSMTTQVPMVTLMNGQIGTVMDTSQSPFVISVIPVVGQNTFQNYGAANSIAGRFLRGEIHFDESGNLQPGPNRELPRTNPNQPRVRIVPKNPRPPVNVPKVHKPEKTLKIRAQDNRPEVARGGGGAFGGSTAETPSLSLREILREKEALEQQQQAEARKYLDQARRARAEGKENVAKIYFRMAVRRAQGDLKAEIKAQLEN